MLGVWRSGSALAVAVAASGRSSLVTLFTHLQAAESSSSADAALRLQDNRACLDLGNLQLPDPARGEGHVSPPSCLCCKTAQHTATAAAALRVCRRPFTPVAKCLRARSPAGSSGGGQHLPEQQSRTVRDAQPAWLHALCFWLRPHHSLQAQPSKRTCAEEEGCNKGLNTRTSAAVACQAGLALMGAVAPAHGARCGSCVAAGGTGDQAG